MRFAHSLSRNLFLAFILSSLAIGFSACTKGQDTPQETGSTFVADSTQPACGTPEFKDHPGCQLVNTRFSGHLKVGLLTLEGITKNTFYPNGKLHDQKTYSEEGSDNTVLEVDISYNNEGQRHVVTTKADLKPAGIGDKVIDTQITATWEYLPDGKPSNVTTIHHGVPSLPADPKLETSRGYIYPSPVIRYSSETGTWSNTPGWDFMNMEFYEDNPDGYPERIVKLLQLPTGQEKAEEHTYVYENGRPASSVGKYFHCPSQPAPSVFLATGYCITNATGGIAVVNDNGVPHGIQNIEWKYDDKGRVNRMEVSMDGDIYNHDPATNMGPTGGGLELEWWCDITYDDSFPEATLAAFPKEFEIFGLKETDKLESIVCDDNKGLVSAELNFDGWAYLHEVSADVAGPQ